MRYLCYKDIVYINIYLLLKGGDRVTMGLVRLIVSLPRPLKAKLDAKRQEGYTASGYVRRLLERDLNGPKAGRKGG